MGEMEERIESNNVIMGRLLEYSTTVDNLGKSSDETVHFYDRSSSQGTTFTLQTLPSMRLNTSGVVTDVIWGFTFAAVFTIVVTLIAWFFNWCCVCLFFPALHRKRLRRKRLKERRKWILTKQIKEPATQLMPLKHCIEEEDVD